MRVLRKLSILAPLFSLIFLSGLHAAPSTWQSEYGALLKKYTTPSGVRYRAWHGNATDMARLKIVLKRMAKVNARSLGKNDRAAFRINLYNASMLNVVLDNYPLKTVTKIGFFPFSVFKKNHVSTSRGKISLNTLEKKQLLVDFPDSRVHFAVNCASRSCPPLRSDIYTGGKLNAQLNEQAQHFADSREAVYIKGNTAYYSELFKWYAKDFKTSNPAKVLNKYRSKKLSSRLSTNWQKYDWSLNLAK